MASTIARNVEACHERPLIWGQLMLGAGSGRPMVAGMQGGITKGSCRSASSLR
jgi:hypothetical protein